MARSPGDLPRFFSHADQDIIMRRSGFTLIEIMVVLGITALLLVITGLAIQQIRERARLLECQHRLKEVGLAVQTHVANNRLFPDHLHSISPLKFGPDNSQLGVIGGRTTATGLICPADTKAVREYEHQNYLYSSGTRFLNCPKYDGIYRPNTAANSDRNRIGPQAIVDGLSSTILVSERLAVGFESSILLEEELLADAKRYEWHVASYATECGQESLAAQNCRSLRTTQSMPNGIAIPRAGSDRFNNLLGPNQFPCNNSQPLAGNVVPGGVSPDQPSTAILPATSQHHGGVNIGLADGAVRFISDNIDLLVWRALGSIDGNETISDY